MIAENKKIEGGFLIRPKIEKITGGRRKIRKSSKCN